MMFQEATDLLQQRWTETFGHIEQEDGDKRAHSQYGTTYHTFDAARSMTRFNMTDADRPDTDALIRSHVDDVISELLQKVADYITAFDDIRMVMRVQPSIEDHDDFESGLLWVRARVRLHAVNAWVPRVAATVLGPTASMPVPLNAVQVDKYDRATVVKDLRDIADNIERGESGNPGKFILITLQDFECEGGGPTTYAVRSSRTRMYDREALALLDHQKTYLSLKLWGLVKEEGKNS